MFKDFSSSKKNIIDIIVVSFDAHTEEVISKIDHEPERFPPIEARKRIHRLVLYISYLFNSTKN